MVLAIKSLVFSMILLRVQGVRNKFELANNGYSDVLVAIHDDMKEDPNLLPRIQEVLIEFSAFMYQATRKRAYLKNVKILVPRSWPDKEEYIPAGRERVNTANILVDEPPLSPSPHIPTRQNQMPQTRSIRTSACRAEGENIYMTKMYLMNQTFARQYGTYGQVLMHEWAHLRWGVFDEFPSTGSNATKYYNISGDPEATRCPLHIKGEWYDISTNKRCRQRDDKNCYFKEDNYTIGTASLMYRQYLHYITHFCDDGKDPRTKHNKEAPTPQNTLCNYESVWEVMRGHRDFNNTNPAADIASTVPVFHLLRQTTRRTVLTLDISGSMSRDNRDKKLAQACYRFIDGLADDDMAAMVWFNESVYVRQNLTSLSQVGHRKQLQGQIPKLSRGATNIWGGVTGAIDVLRYSGDPAGGIIVLISDGRSTDGPFLDEVWDQILEANVTIHTVAVTEYSSTDLDVLAAATGGMAFLYSAFDKSTALNEAMDSILEANTSPVRRRLTLKSEAYLIGGQTTHSDHVTLDVTVGENTTFVFDYTGSGIEVTLTAPSGEVFQTDQFTSKNEFGIYQISPTAKQTIGQWSFTIRSTDISEQRVAVTVTSQARDRYTLPILAQSFWNTRKVSLAMTGREPDKQILYVAVSQGNLPVLNAAVTAIVERPGVTSPVTKKLKDDGTLPDVTKDDGIYSAYFIDFTENGRYNVKVKVNGEPTTVISPRRILGRGAARDPAAEQEADVPSGVFQRVTTAGSFELIDYTPGVLTYAPARIIDLREHAVLVDVRHVTLRWTATGQQLDVGTASRYELRMSTVFENLRLNFANQTLVDDVMVVSGANLSQPSPSGQEEEITLSMPPTGDLYVFAILAHGLDGKTSPVSNIVSVSLRAPPTESPGEISTSSTANTNPGEVMVLTTVRQRETWAPSTGRSGETISPSTDGTGETSTSSTTIPGVTVAPSTGRAGQTLTPSKTDGSFSSTEKDNNFKTRTQPVRVSGDDIRTTTGLLQFSKTTGTTQEKTPQSQPDMTSDGADVFSTDQAPPPRGERNYMFLIYTVPGVLGIIILLASVVIIMKIIRKRPRIKSHNDLA